MRTHCPVCGGLGTIPDPKNIGVLMGYCGPNGERSPHIIYIAEYVRKGGGK